MNTWKIFALGMLVFIAGFLLPFMSA